MPFCFVDNNIIKVMEKEGYYEKIEGPTYDTKKQHEKMLEED